MPVGALLGGVLGQLYGPRAALWVGALGELFAVLPVLASPLRTMRELPRTTVAATSVAATVIDQVGQI